jgi:hypothetical protein
LFFHYILGCIINVTFKICHIEDKFHSEFDCLEKVRQELNVGFRLHEPSILSRVFFCNYFGTKEVKSFIYDYDLRYLDAKKKKHKKEDEDETPNFPGREQIKFGDVVQAPPKLTAPKVSLSL